MAEVSVGRDELLVGGVLPHVSLAHDHDVVSLAEGVTIVGNGLEVNFRVFSRSHVARRAVEVPHGDLINCGDFLLESSALGAENDARTINPDVFCNDLASLVEALSNLVLVLKILLRRFESHLEVYC